MNEQLIIPYLGTFLSLFLISFSFLVKQNETARKMFIYSGIILSALNLFLCYSFNANDLFFVVNGGAIAVGAGGLLDD
jgi:heme O synthase-like polyprenyltransferase